MDSEERLHSESECYHPEEEDFSQTTWCFEKAYHSFLFLFLYLERGVWEKKYIKKLLGFGSHLDTVFFSNTDLFLGENEKKHNMLLIVTIKDVGENC